MPFLHWPYTVSLVHRFEALYSALFLIGWNKQNICGYFIHLRVVISCLWLLKLLPVIWGYTRTKFQMCDHTFAILHFIYIERISEIHACCQIGHLLMNLCRLNVWEKLIKNFTFWAITDWQEERELLYKIIYVFYKNLHQNGTKIKIANIAHCVEYTSLLMYILHDIYYYYSSTQPVLYFTGNNTLTFTF